MAEIGTTPGGGCNRQALTEADGEARALFRRWCKAAGYPVRVDAIGNSFARRPGSDDAAPPILIGSHLDTQPRGGRFDGAYGVLAGLEVLRSLDDLGITTRSPIELVSWTNEEGARFAPAMMGSGVWAGEFDLEATYAVTDREGVTVRQALESIGQLGETPAEPFPVKGALEIHIEQGPVLETEARQIGVVTGVQGIRWYDLVLSGSACHAGPTPMEDRRDPVRPLGALLDAAYALAEDTAPWGRVTFGDLRAEPGSRNTVPERLTVTLDLRHPDQAALDSMHERLRALIAQHDSSRVAVTLTEVWSSPAVVFDPGCIEAVHRSVERLGYYASMEIVSGAGHDSVYVSRVAPASMIFIPCRGGLSHNEAEYASPEDVAAGGNVLLRAVLELDRGS